MKKTLTGLILLTSFLALTAEAVWINQVYYDPLGSETYGEALELYNPANESTDISGWIIMTASSETDVIIPENIYIEPNGYFLIADEGWNESKDNATWRYADLEEKMTLKNTNGGAALKDKEGNIVDAVGWGDEEEISDELFEGLPAKKVKSGKSLLRIADTNDNSQDFIIAQPYFFTTGEIIINTEIGNEETSSDNIQVLEDDDPAEGIQITPVKGGSRKVRVRAYRPGLLMFGGKTYNLTQTNNSYEAVIEITYSLEPGIYALQIGQESTDVEILPIRGLSVDQRTVDLDVVPGSYGTKKINIKNTGNTELRIFAKCQKLMAEKNELDGQINAFGKILDDKWQEIATLVSGENKEIEIAVTASETAEKGDYRAILSFKGE